MIDFEKEREAFFYELNGRGYEFENKTWIHGLGDVGGLFDDDQLNMVWEMYLAGQELKQAEIDSLKAYRNDFEIIQQTIALVDLLATSTNVYQRDPSCLYPFESENPRVKEWWRTACKIQELLTNTDPENCDFDEYKKMIEAAQENSHE